jgi:hypothetical protein
MAKQSKRRHDEEPVFYEAMPMAHSGYGAFGDEIDNENEAAKPAPDHDFAALDDTGRDMAVRTLVFVALATVVICLLLVWAVQAAQTVLPAGTGSVPPGR